MRLRVEAVLCLFLAFAVTGCRKGLDSGANTNQAPETWITASPQDTITIKDASGVVVSAGTPGLIPVRFHVYWAGADRDGAVSGFWWAVTDTDAVPLAPGFPVPNLPGPKPGDLAHGGSWSFTTRTDSIFTFKVDIQVPDRMHAFYVYSVDDKGKADATPARFTFRAYDRYPPLGVMDEASGRGTVYKRDPFTHEFVPKDTTYNITDSSVVSRSFPNDTVPSGALLTFRWHGEPRAPGMTVSRYLFQLGGLAGSGDSSTRVATYNTGAGVDTVAPGTKTFTLYTVGQSGWRSVVTRFFQMNFAPDSWFSGPNLADAQWRTYRDGNNRLYYFQDVVWSSLIGSAGLPGTLMSADSVNVLPSSRPERRTFFELYADRIWAHQEGDTVNLNSWVVVPSGGTDPDSRYAVHVGLDPTRPIGPVTTASGPNGSPVGFRYRVDLQKPNGQIVSPSESPLYPVFDKQSVFHSPTILCYAPMSTTGKCYLYTSAEDGDGTVDRRISRAGGGQVVAEHVDAGVGDAYERAVRNQIMVFYVNRKPYLKTGDGQFLPRANGSTSIQRGAQVTFSILAGDDDPIDFSRSIDRVGGPQPGAGTVLSRTIDIRGTNQDGRDTTYNVATAIEFPNVSFVVPTFFLPGAAHVIVTVCDYRPADGVAGNFGRCSDPLDIPITITGPQPALPATGLSQSTSRPGSTSTDGRRQQP